MRRFPVRILGLILSALLPAGVARCADEPAKIVYDFEDPADPKGWSIG